MKAIQLTGYGDPREVVKLIDVPEIGTPGPEEIIIDVEAAPIEPSDLYIIAGAYGILPPLPHILGIQGVGRVSAVGENVKHLKVGDRTIAPLFLPTFTDRVKTSVTYLRPLPAGDVTQLAMLGLNPATAYIALTDFVQLKSGDWIIMNAPTSSVGKALLAVAKSFGYHVISIAHHLEQVEDLKALETDIVIVEGPDLADRVAELAGSVKIKLALDGIGDTATQNLLNCLPVGSSLVVWSMLSGKPFTVNGAKLLFHSHNIYSFWVYNWFRTAGDEKIVKMYEVLAPMVASGKLQLTIAGEYGFEQFQEALEVAAQYKGKAIFIPGK